MFTVFSNGKFFCNYEDENVAKRQARNMSLKYKNEIWKVMDTKGQIVIKYLNGSIVAE